MESARKVRGIAARVDAARHRGAAELVHGCFENQCAGVFHGVVENGCHLIADTDAATAFIGYTLNVVTEEPQY